MPTNGLPDPDRERVRRAADLLDEALPQLGLRPGVGKVKRALDTLSGVEGVEPVCSGSEDVARMRGRPSAGRRDPERRAEA